MRQVDIDEIDDALERGEVVFDARPPARTLPGSRPLTLERLRRGELPELARDTRIYLVCDRGLISELMALHLEAAGYSDVAHLRGGLRAWRRR